MWKWSLDGGHWIVNVLTANNFGLQEENINISKQIQIQNCLFDIICQVIEQHTLCIINVRRLPLRQLVVADMGATYKD